jgi:short-subunit dehydrogenase
LKPTFIETLLFPKTKLNAQQLRQKINGKTIVITGASFGIGEQLALLFSNYYVHLVLIARSQDKLAALSKTIIENGSGCTIIAADLYQEHDLDLVIKQLASLEKGIDIFISNAGKSITRSLLESIGRYQDLIKTNTLNYLAPAKMMLAITPILSQNKGQIINVSAMNVLLLPAPKWAAYQASKSALDQWMRCHWAEWKVMGIQVKTIYLPLVRTRMIAPNLEYQHYPAMQPDQAAVRIANLISSNQTLIKPWWAIFPQTASFFGRAVWQTLSYLKARKK